MFVSHGTAIGIIDVRVTFLRQMQPELDQKRFGMVPSQRVEDFFMAYHKYLKDSGVDGVKVKKTLI